MRCPACHYNDTKVINSRSASDGFLIRRRRECLKCNFRFSTYEEIEILDLSIVKSDGKKENYSKGKLIKDLKKALEKRSVSDEKFKKLINAIERDIQTLNKNQITSQKIGLIVMRHLKKLDKVAYIRFASVYKSFEDLEEFNQELGKLLKRRKTKSKIPCKKQ